jgi:hypothetical protein
MMVCVSLHDTHKEYFMKVRWGLVVVVISLGSLVFATDRPTGTAHPKVAIEQARKIALAKEPGKIQSEELEKEKGRLIYSFDIQTEKALHEVNVDAMSGTVVEDSIEDPAKEAAEKAQEKKERKKHTAKTFDQ